MSYTMAKCFTKLRISLTDIRFGLIIGFVALNKNVMFWNVWMSISELLGFADSCYEIHAVFVVVATDEHFLLE